MVAEERRILTAAGRDALIDAVVDEALGLGPLEALLRDPHVTEVMVCGPHRVFVERAGRIAPVPTRFHDDAHLLHVIDRILAPLGRRCDEASPMVDARLPDGSRVNAVIPPLALDGPALTIRRFAGRAFNRRDLVDLGRSTGLCSTCSPWPCGRAATCSSRGGPAAARRRRSPRWRRSCRRPSAW
jgi:pilus assembly protein CpaF